MKKALIGMGLILLVLLSGCLTDEQFDRLIKGLDVDIDPKPPEIQLIECVTDAVCWHEAKELCYPATYAYPVNKSSEVVNHQAIYSYHNNFDEEYGPTTARIIGLFEDDMFRETCKTEYYFILRKGRWPQEEDVLMEKLTCYQRIGAHYAEDCFEVELMR